MILDATNIDQVYEHYLDQHTDPVPTPEFGPTCLICSRILLEHDVCPVCDFEDAPFPTPEELGAGEFILPAKE